MTLNFSDILQESLLSIQNASKNPYGFVGLPSGLKDLDNTLCGFDNSDLIVVGARPAMGKTGFLLTLAINMAEREIPVLFYSLEMSNPQIVNRMLSNITGIEGNKLSSGRMSEEEWGPIIKVGKGMGEYPRYLTDKCDWKIEDFCKKVREDVEETGAKIIFIDYLQLFSTRERLQNRYEEVALCTRELKLLARELNLPVIVASQLNRNVENRTTGIFREKMPQMFDLRDSGTICDDANVVMLLYRPEYYTRSTEDENGYDIRGLAEVIIAKNHMGREDTIRLKFSPETGKFEDWKSYEPEVPFINRPNYEETLDNFDSLSSPF